MRITEEMWLPWRKEANRPRAGALQNSTCPAWSSRITGSGSASAMTFMAAAVRPDEAERLISASCAGSASWRGSSSTEATKLVKAIRAKALERPAISTRETMITATATICQSEVQSRVPSSRRPRMTA